MKLYTTILVTLSLLVVLSSCSPDEPLLNSYDGRWRILATGSHGLYTVLMPDGTVQNTVWQPSAPSAPYPVTRVLEFRDRLYLLLTSPEIVVLDRATFDVVGTITLPTPAAGMAFANATTAYASLPQTAAVAVVDLTVFSVASTIAVGSAPTDIVAVANQVCVLLPQTTEAKIIDSRTNTVESTITLPYPSPTFVGGDGMAGVFCIVMKGAGKDSGSTELLSTPMMSSIDIATRKILTTVPLTVRESEGPQQIPGGLAVNSNSFCYVPVQGGLLQATTRSPKRAAAVQFAEYHGVWYDASRARLLCVGTDGKSVVVYDEYAENIVSTVTLPDSTTCLVGLAP